MEIGDKVYHYDKGGRIHESIITKKYIENYIYDTDNGLFFDSRDIGKSIYMSEAAAKKAFKEANYESEGEK